MTEEHSSGTAPTTEGTQADTPAEDSRHSLEAVNGSVKSPAARSALKILVVDDSSTIRRSAETMLQTAGFEVVTAENGFEALSKVARHNPDLIFVDIMMPRLDGYQTCSLIKNNTVFKTTPVIMLSSKDGLFDRAKGRIVGSEQYLTKPFTKDELIGAIERHVER